MTQILKDQLDYSELLRVLGHFIQQERLTDISILEYDQGWIIHGLVYKSTSNGFVRVTSDFVVTHEDVRKLHEKQREQRKEAPQQKRRWGLSDTHR
jgi:hypothetical protein